jgi:DNA-binding NtrC family response regulator
VAGFSAEAMDLLLRYQWPGNVRELRTAVEHAVVLSRGDRVTPRDLPAWVRNAPAGAAASQPAAADSLSLKQGEKERIIHALKVAEGNRTLAAKKLAISRRTLYRKLHEYNLEKS